MQIIVKYVKDKSLGIFYYFTYYAYIEVIMVEVSKFVTQSRDENVDNQQVIDAVEQAVTSIKFLVICSPQ